MSPRENGFNAKTQRRKVAKKNSLLLCALAPWRMSRFSGPSTYPSTANDGDESGLLRLAGFVAFAPNDRERRVLREPRIGRGEAALPERRAPAARHDAGVPAGPAEAGVHFFSSSDQPPSASTRRQAFFRPPKPVR